MGVGSEVVEWVSEDDGRQGGKVGVQLKGQTNARQGVWLGDQSEDTAVVGARAASTAFLVRGNDWRV